MIWIILAAKLFLGKTCTLYHLWQPTGANKWLPRNLTISCLCFLFNLRCRMKTTWTTTVSCSKLQNYPSNRFNKIRNVLGKMAVLNTIQITKGVNKWPPRNGPLLLPGWNTSVLDLRAALDFWDMKVSNHKVTWTTPKIVCWLYVSAIHWKQPFWILNGLWLNGHSQRYVLYVLVEFKKRGNTSQMC